MEDPEAQLEQICEQIGMCHTDIPIDHIRRILGAARHYMLTLLVGPRRCPVDYPFSATEKACLRPMAETLAMLDGNAFFGMDTAGKEHYEYYLPEAKDIFDANGGMTGWSGEASFARPYRDT